MESLEIFADALELFTCEDKAIEKKYKECINLLLAELVIVEFTPSSELEILLNDLQDMLPNDETAEEDDEEEEESISWEEDDD